MTIRTRTADALIGLLVVGTIILTIVALAVTRGWTERRITIFMRSPSVQDLKEDTPVFLQGLMIGEITAISPVVDSASMAPPEFLVALRLRERYANGLPIQLPLGTAAEIITGGFIGSASVALVIPPHRSVAALAPGDTIRATRQQSATDVLKEVADSLKTQISDVLRETRKLLATLDRTAAAAEAEVRQTGPEVRATLQDAQHSLDHLATVLADADTLVRSANGRLGLVQDSLLATLGDARRVLQSSDSLTRALREMTTDMTPDIVRTMESIAVITAKLEHFVDEFSRRPTRFFTGVKPLPRDSALKDSTP